MKKNSSSRSAAKGRNSNSKRHKYFVDNPNTSELSMLDQSRKKRVQGASVNTTADTRLSSSDNLDSNNKIRVDTGERAGLASNAIYSSSSAVSPSAKRPIVKLSSIVGSSKSARKSSAKRTMKSIVKRTVKPEEPTPKGWQTNVSDLLPVMVMDTRIEQRIPQAPLEMMAVAHATDAIDEQEMLDKLSEKHRGDHYKALIHADHIAEGAVLSHHLCEQCILTAHLSADAVRSENIADFSIISSKLAADCIQGDHIAGLSILSHHIADQVIRPYHLQTGVIEREAIALGSVDGMRLALDAICAVHVQDNAITGRAIQAKAISSEKLADHVVAGWHIQPQSIESHHLQRESVATDVLQDGSVTSDKLACDAVSAMHLLEEAVQSVHIEDGAVTSSKLAEASISGEHVREGSIYERHLGFTPVRACSERTPAMQFGVNSFVLEEGADSTEVSIVFPEAYDHARYSLVSSTNVRGCYAAILEQYKDGAVVQIICQSELPLVMQSDEAGCSTTRASASKAGSLSWIVIG